ncbi:hypothetical protein FCV53_02520 [Vibrio sp. F12]|uniref:hypothetical protein n=1 Tax=Vibrio sp. F12 TaxID=2070776 RepID=UPI0010BDDE4D|nr:hypothetical protein [Vibrio sp. F12]TKE94351.1 hypothetical protein FCV53_02520 [Vibrio sp. F12]
MLIIAPELVPLCRYIRESVVTALGGEPKDWHTGEQLDEFIAQINGHILSLLHDLIVTLDYLMVLIRANTWLNNEEDEVCKTASRLIVEVKTNLAL